MTHRRPERGARLEPAHVPPEIYDERYYCEGCAGAERWSASEGHLVDGLYHGVMERVGLEPGATVVDVGTGRGELLVVAAQRDAAAAIGVDYSWDAVRLASRTIRAHEADERCLALQADAWALPLPDGSADVVTMLDVVEHLTPGELHATLVESRRILRPGGMLFVHTFPTSTIYDVTYRIQRALLPWRWSRWPADPRSEDERQMHVNEQTRTRLHRSLVEDGLTDVEVEHGAWVHTTFLPHERHGRIYEWLARHRLTRQRGPADLWATARAPAEASDRARPRL